MGFGSSLSAGWRFMKEAFAMAREDRSLLKPSVYLVMTTVVYFVVWVGIVLAAEVDFESSGGAVIGASITFGSFLIFYFFCGMTVNMVDVHLEGGEPSVGEAFRDARQNFLAICTLALVSTIVELIAKSVRNRRGGGIVGSIIAGIIESVWTMLSFLLLPAIIIEDISLGAALRRTKELHKGNLLLVGIGEVGVRFVTGLISFVVTLIICLVVYFALAVVGGTGGVVIAFVAGGTMLALLAAFNTFIRMAYYTCLYLWAVDVEKQGPAARAPLPLARALGR